MERLRRRSIDDTTYEKKPVGATTVEGRGAGGVRGVRGVRGEGGAGGW